MLSIAFKEWAVICRALAEGSQAIILRKGGIAESGGVFRPEHPRFLLYPTHFHEQHRVGIKPGLLPLLDAAEAERPNPGTVRFTHFADVVSVHHMTDLNRVLALDPLHGWTSEEVARRFRYRTPGLYVLVVRVAALPSTWTVDERPEYAGCKTWVELCEAIPTDGATPVMTDEAFATYLQQLRDAAACVD